MTGQPSTGKLEHPLLTGQDKRDRPPGRMMSSTENRKGSDSMLPIRFIHAADLHLGRPFSGLTRSDPTLGRLFQQAGYKAWDRIVRTAVEKKVDFLALAGDVFDRTSPTIRARVAFKEGLEGLNQAGIPVFLALGNHDPISEFPDALRFVPGLYVFGPQPEAREFVRPGLARTLKVHGVSFDGPAVKENLVRCFRRDSGAEIAIGIVHANVAGIAGHDNYAPCSIDDLTAAGMDVWCMGHVHAAKVLRQKPLILYAGTSQGAHVNEPGARGCYLVTVDGPGDASAEFLPVAPVHWEEIEVDITGVSNEEGLLEAAEQACQRLCVSEEDLEAIVTRIHLIGRDRLHLRGAYERMSEIGDVLSERLARLPIPVLPESMRDRTRSTLGLDAILQQEGFLADVLKLSRMASEQPGLGKELVDSIRESLPKTAAIEVKSELEQLREPKTLAAFLDEARELVAELFLE
jgi:DNA repair exonuclease SbcCD nuclease subunit